MKREREIFCSKTNHDVGGVPANHRLWNFSRLRYEFHVLVHRENLGTPSLPASIDDREILGAYACSCEASRLTTN